MFRRKPADGSLLAEARRRKLQRDEEQERERVGNAEELASLYFELEEALAPRRVAGFAERALPACGWLAETQYCWSDSCDRRQRRDRTAEGLGAPRARAARASRQLTPAADVELPSESLLRDRARDR
jgi:hypothetical protein